MPLLAWPSLAVLPFNLRGPFCCVSLHVWEHSVFASVWPKYTDPYHFTLTPLIPPPPPPNLLPPTLINLQGSAKARAIKKNEAELAKNMKGMRH